MRGVDELALFVKYNADGREAQDTTASFAESMESAYATTAHWLIFLDARTRQPQ